MEQPKLRTSKEFNLYILLSALFISNALIAELIGVKIFSLEKLLHIPPVDMNFIAGSRLNLNMSVGILIWPIVFILSDIINEFFGKSGVKRISYIGAGAILYAFIIIFFSTRLPAADFWLKANSINGNGTPFNIDFAYSTIFRQGLGIIVGSITAFLVGQLVDIYTFHFLRRLTHQKRLWLRATGSTVVSQLIDSFLVLFIAFYWLGNWSFIEVISVGLIQYIYKITIAIVLTPVIYWMHNVIDKYLGKNISEKMIETVSSE